jgi:hypothetical protein
MNEPFKAWKNALTDFCRWISLPRRGQMFIAFGATVPSARFGRQVFRDGSIYKHFT